MIPSSIGEQKSKPIKELREKSWAN